MTVRRLLGAVAVVLTTAAAASADSETLARVGDAFATRDTEANTFTVGSSAVSFTLGFDSAGGLRAVELKTPRMASPVAITPGPTSVITLNGRQITLTSSELSSVTGTRIRNGVRLDLTFALRSAPIRVTRSFAVYIRAPVVEVWTTFETLSGSVAVDGLNAWQLTVPPGTLRTVSGLLGDDADNSDASRADQFTIRRETVATGTRESYGAAGRSSERTVPWFAVERNDSVFFGGLMWSGAWTLSVDHGASGIRIAIGADATTSVGAGARLEAPHGFFGVTGPGASEAPRGLADFVSRGVRGGLPFRPLVTYNTWFAYGAEVDEASMFEAVDAAARLGVELFVLDAGWYAGAGRGGPRDFTSGLGSYDADPARFPSGLRGVAEAVESRGMQFGIWVEPERVALTNVGRNGLDERWLATRDGHYIPGVAQAQARAAQLCLADARARQWLLEQLVKLIDAVGPAYLKWDNNFWINCNRSGHGHGAGDGNYAHVAGLYSVLAELRDRYPDLKIENVSGGGNRLDFGMLKYTDTAWMDDRTTPSSIVRHNLQGLYEVFPPAYLLSFAMGSEEEPLHDGDDLMLYVRSRMPGVLGLTMLPDELSSSEELEFGREIAHYKAIVPTLRIAAGVLLTAQAGPRQAGWDVMEAVTAAGRAVLYAFQADPAAGSTVVVPRGLRRSRTYDIVSFDRGLIGSATGADLMRDGIEIAASRLSAAHILSLEPRTSDP